MILEKYIDQGILFERILQASKRTPITFDDGVMRVNNHEFGVKGLAYTLEVFESGLEEAYAEEGA